MNVATPIEPIRNLVAFCRLLAEPNIGIRLVRFERVSMDQNGTYIPARDECMGVTRKIEAHSSESVTFNNGKVLRFYDEGYWVFANDTATITTPYLILGYQIVRTA